MSHHNCLHCLVLRDYLVTLPVCSLSSPSDCKHMTSNLFKAQDILNFDPPFHLRDPNFEPGFFKILLSKGTHTHTHNIQLFWTL